MLFEKLGRFFFFSMRPVFFFLFLLTPIFVSFTFFLSALFDKQEFDIRLTRAMQNERKALEKKAKKERFLKRYSKTEPYFMAKLENMPLLEKEKEALQKLVSHPAIPNPVAIRERLAFLNKNHLAFIEKEARDLGGVKEVIEKLHHTAHVSESDLKQLLAIIENIQIGDFLPNPNSPQLVIKNLSLKKQKSPLQTEYFELDMELIKREFS